MTISFCCLCVSRDTNAWGTIAKGHVNANFKCEASSMQEPCKQVNIMTDINEMNAAHNAQPNRTHQNTRMCVVRRRKMKHQPQTQQIPRIKIDTNTLNILWRCHTSAPDLIYIFFECSSAKDRGAPSIITMASKGTRNASRPKATSLEPRS